MDYSTLSLSFLFNTSSAFLITFGTGNPAKVTFYNILIPYIEMNAMIAPSLITLAVSTISICSAITTSSKVKIFLESATFKDSSSTLDNASCKISYALSLSLPFRSSMDTPNA